MTARSCGEGSGATDKARLIKRILLIALFAAAAVYIGVYTWDVYQDARCERILMDLSNRDGEEAVRCFRRFSGE